LRLVHDLLDSAPSGGKTIVGRESVLHEVFNGSIQQLIIVDDLQVDGRACLMCGRLVAAPYDTCPACGGVLVPVDDVVDEAIRRTLESGGSVEIVHGAAKEALLAQCGGLAARLRYRSTTLTGATGTR
jgi:peptide subunit release factor 1 (eRF1)